MFARFSRGSDEFDALRMRGGDDHGVDLRIGQQGGDRIEEREALFLGVIDRLLRAGARGAGDDTNLVALALNAIDEVLPPAAEADDACIDHGDCLA